MAVDIPSIRERVTELGERIRREDGFGRAVKLAEQHFRAQGDLRGR